MKYLSSIKCFTPIIIIAIVIYSVTINAQIPQKINYQGYLEESGVPMNGTKSLTFTLYDAPAGGEQVWTESKAITIINGNFSTLLGEINPIDLAEAKPYWLGIKIGTAQELLPRKELASAIYSLFVDGITLKNHNVGINTDFPTAKLDIRTSSADESAIDIYHDGTHVRHFDKSGVQQFYEFYDAPKNQYRFTSTKAGHILTFDLDSGKLAFNTDNPTATLTARGSRNDSVMDLYNNGTHVRHFDANGNQKFYEILNNDFYEYRSGLNNAYMMVVNVTNGNIGFGGHPEDNLHVFGNVRIANGKRLILENSTMTSNVKMYWDGSYLNINSPIKAPELIITTDVWADFVFEKNYELMPLQKIEHYIKKNKHLPGIPSKKEVTEHGVDIGEMQSKLLQKIEELTLHMIALKKENSHLKERVMALESIVND